MLQLFDMTETGGLELASTITRVLQANRLTKCASQEVLMSVKTPPGMILQKKYFKVISNSIMATQKCKANLLT